jgi:hypothetical protein
MQSYNIDFDNLQMEKGFDEHTSYSSSKLCNAMHAIELATRWGLVSRVSDVELVVWIFCTPSSRRAGRVRC